MTAITRFPAPFPLELHHVHRAQSRSLDMLAHSRETETCLLASNAHDDRELTHKQRMWRALLRCRAALADGDLAEAKRQNFIAMREANAAELADLAQRAEVNRALGRIDPAICCSREVSGWFEEAFPVIEQYGRLRAVPAAQLPLDEFDGGGSVA